MAEFDAGWDSPGGPAALVPGKMAMARLNDWAQTTLNVSVTPAQVASEFAIDDVPIELRTFLRQLAALRRTSA